MLAAAAAGILFLTTTHAASEPGPFFEADQPFFHTQVQVTPAVQADTVETNFVVRGILIPFPTGHALVFDQELLRIAGFWAVPTGIPPITPATMAQTSYDRPRRKAGSIHPAPTGPLLLMTPMHPGAVEGSAVPSRTATDDDDVEMVAAGRVFAHVRPLVLDLPHPTERAGSSRSARDQEGISST